jgi:hypothetical protein
MHEPQFHLIESNEDTWRLNIHALRSPSVRQRFCFYPMLMEFKGKLWNFSFLGLLVHELKTGLMVIYQYEEEILL